MMKVDADVRNQKLTFTGMPNDIIACKVAMYELINTMISEEIYGKLTGLTIGNNITLKLIPIK